MNSPKQLKLSLSDLKPAAAAAPNFVSFLSISPSSSPKLKRYIDGLVDERLKIEAFKHDFPLSIVLLNQVIDRLRGDEDEKVKEDKCSNSVGNRGSESEFDEDDKKHWMSSVQLWCSSSSPIACPSTFLQNNKENEGVRSDQVHGSGKYNDNKGAFPSFNRTNPINSDAANLTVTTNSQQRSRRGPVVTRGRAVAARPVVLPNQISAVNKMPNPNPPPPYLAARKARRNWSPELHRRFVDSLEKLGGPQVATPKQIRDLMQVEGLTNDEVKSHLQKYRLHVRKVPSSSPASSNEISMGQVLQLDVSSKAGTSFSDSPEGPLQLTMRSNNCNSSAASGESSMEEDQRSDGRR
ncbi:Transcription factor HHO5-like protein [Drosera capensis]